MRKTVRTESTVNQITDGVIWKQLLVFFFPIFLGTLFQQLYNTADAIIVGKYVGKEALAAVGGTTGNLINLIVGFFVSLSSGASVIISQYYGARKENEVGRAVHTALALAVTGGALFMMIGVLFTPTLLRWMGTPEDVMEYAVSYTRIFFMGMIPSMIYNIGSGALRAVGDSRRPLVFLICACGTNIVLDILFVMGLNMGVTGAAVATVLSQGVSAVLTLITLCRSHASYRVTLRRVRFYSGMLRRIIRIGLPSGLQSVMYSLSNVIIQMSVNAFGTDVLAAWSAYGRMDGMFWMIISAFGISITTFAGQNFGAKRYDRMRKSVRVCFGLSLLATVLLSSTVLLLGRPLFYLFTDDAEVVRIGLTIQRLIVPTYFTYICIEIFSGALRGMGDTLVPTLMTLTGVCALRIIWVLGVVPAHHNIPTLMLSYPISWTITSLMFLIYYLKGGWMKRCISRAGLDA